MSYLIRSAVKVTVESALLNNHLVIGGFKNRKVSKLYEEARKDGYLTGKIISKAHYDEVCSVWGYAKKSFSEKINQVFDEEMKEKYKEIRTQVDSIKNKEEWKLTCWYVEFLEEAKRGKVSNEFVEKTKEYFTSLIRPEYLELCEEYMCLDAASKEYDGLNSWLETYEPKVKEFLKGTIVETEAEFLEELKRLKLDKQINSKKR